MDDIILNLLVIAGFAIVGTAGFLFFRRRQAQREEELLQFVAQNGWRMEFIREPLAKGIRLLSTDWNVEAVSRSHGQSSSPGSSNLDMSTTFTTHIPGSTVLTGPVSSQADLGSMGAMLTRKVLELALGEAARSVEEVSLGSTEFQQRFMVWAQNPFDARELINPEVQDALLSWNKKPPVIKRTFDGLSMKIDGLHLTSIQDLQQFIRLGELLLRQ